MINSDGYRIPKPKKPQIFSSLVALLILMLRLHLLYILEYSSTSTDYGGFTVRDCLPTTGPNASLEKGSNLCYCFK